MLSNVDKNVFLNSEEVQLVPVVSGEWNQNFFNSPYITVAGNGVKETISANQTYTAVTDLNKHPYFTTKSFSLSNNTGEALYSCTPASSSAAYKIITYVRTDNSTPIMVNFFAKGSKTQFGSSSAEINNYGWTKMELFMGGSSASDTISSIAITLVCNTLASYPLSANVYFTVPEVYANEYFNYQYNSIWPTDSPFTFFRPGESYVNSGNSAISFPSNFRKVVSDAKRGFSGDLYAPVSSITENPKHLFITPYNPFIKNVLPTDIAAYKYFVSESVNNPYISAIYPKAITSNKIVLKMNNIITSSNVSIYLNGSGSAIYTGTIPSNGVLILYYNGSSWSTTKWTDSPKFLDSGQLSIYTTINKITLKQNSNTVNSVFSVKSGTPAFDDDAKRMQLIELSPRLEIDLSDYVQDVAINKQLDSKSTIVPLSTITADDAAITLSGIPVFTGSDPIPLFSNQSNSNQSILSSMLSKNIKIYAGWKVQSYTYNNSVNTDTTYIPAGVFYSDSWEESDIDSVRIQSYDIVRYLQTLPVPDYVANYKTVYDIISMLLDRAGFTDYDIDSLYSITNDKSAPMDMAYYYANSQDKTVAAALSEIFLAYQIGAYIDEYGVMKFLSLANIIKAGMGSENIQLTDSVIYDNGYNVSNIGKIGKISLRYQEPKVKQSLALQNATDPTQRNSPSFIYTTSNDQVWISNNLDSVGFNYLANEEMSETANKFKYNVNDLLDQFHTFNLNNIGYAAIEDEIVSFEYKEYNISTPTTIPVSVSVKNDIELSSEIDKFVKGNVTPELNITDGSSNTNPTNVTISPSGYITNVKRGLFGTAPQSHHRISSLTNKGLLEATATGSTVTLDSSNTAITSWNPYINAGTSDNKSISVIGCSVPAGKKVMVYPSENDLGYSTYSTKFNITYSNLFAGGIFFNWNGSTSLNNTFFVEMIKHHSGDKTSTSYDLQTGSQTTTTIPLYQYLIVVYKIVNGSSEVIAWSDATSVASAILSNFPKVVVKEPTSNTDLKYANSVDDAFHLKVVHYNSVSGDGEKSGKLIDVFLNNCKITGWMIPDTDTPTAFSNLWKPTEINTVNSIRQLPLLDSNTQQYSGKFGAYVSTTGVQIPTISWDSNANTSISTHIVYNGGNSISTTEVAGSIREIYATEIPLKDRSTNYWHQSQEFLNGMVQGQKIFNIHKSYIMQTTPSIMGINVYDVQYQSPAATNVDILPIQYYYKYYPTGSAVDNKYVNELTVDEYSLSYSVPLNTGFRSKFAIANNSPFMVWIHKTPDQLNTSSTQLVLWTHEIVAQSDSKIIEKVLNSSNISQVAQLDTQWIQSASAAEKLVSTIAQSIDGFSQDTSIRIFGNPLIQLGDIIMVTYKLKGINQKLFVVQSVKHSFNNGLETDLVLNAVGAGIQY